MELRVSLHCGENGALKWQGALMLWLCDISTFVYLRIISSWELNEKDSGNMHSFSVFQKGKIYN